MRCDLEENSSSRHNDLLQPVPPWSASHLRSAEPGHHGRLMRLRPAKEESGPPLAQTRAWDALASWLIRAFPLGDGAGLCGGSSPCTGRKKTGCKARRWRFGADPAADGL
jgi:hypothetical protein